MIEQSVCQSSGLAPSGISTRRRYERVRWDPVRLLRPIHLRQALRWAAAAVGCLAWLLLEGCNKRSSFVHGADASTGSAAPKALRGKPKSATALPTTRADIYFGNLDAQISELTRLTRGRTEMTPDVLMLSAAHYTRGRFKGDLDEIQLAVDGMTTCARLTPNDPVCFVTRAEQEQSLHRFKEARTDVERAKALGVDPKRAAALEMDLDWNDGRYDTAIPAIRAERLRHPSPATWLREAQLDHDLGLEDEADAAFEAAEDLIQDTGPLVPAHLNVQRGIQKVQTGRLDEACVFFRAAVERIPNYVAANEHLAETLHMLGKNEEAIRIYESVVKLTDDPEFSHALGALYASNGKADAARDLEAKAHAGYAALLQKYPEAMYWHASEFYMATGETARALELLRKNVVLRPNSTSFVALARAELAMGQLAEARTSIDKALAMPLVSASLFWTAAQVYASGPDAAKAPAFRARAEKLNPRIATDER
jgi:tetratricopeptide (TPR) repeat protein